MNRKLFSLFVVSFSILTAIYMFIFNTCTVHASIVKTGEDIGLGIYKPLKNMPQTAQQVKVGFFAENIYDIDPANNTYNMDFYMWLNWKGNIDPIAKLELMNGVDDWSTTKEPAYEQPKKLPDGSFYQVLRIDGRFRESFRLERYPLDEQWLGVTIENAVYSLSELVYIADTVESGYARDFSIPGWEFNNHRLQNLYHEYLTNFGDTGTGNKNSIYSTLRYELQVTRPSNYFVWKLLLPLIIVLCASWGALMLDPIRVDSRIILPVTSLLTTVFMQQSYSNALPAVSYLVLLDKIYVLAYIIIVATIMETIYTSTLVRNDNPEIINHVKKIDRILLICSLTTMVTGIILFLLL